MPILSVNVADTFAPRLVAACQAQYPSVVGAQTGGAAVKAVVINLLTNVVSAYEAEQAASARDTAYQNQLQKTQTDASANIS